MENENFNENNTDGNMTYESTDNTDTTNGNIISNEQTPVDTPNPNKKMSFIVGGIAAAVIAALCFMFLGKGGNGLEGAFTATQGDLQKLGALYATEHKQFTPQNELAFDLTLKNVSLKQGTGMFLPNNSQLTGSVNIDEETKRLDASFGVNIANTNIINPEINVDGSFVSLIVPELYDKYISIDLSSANEDIKNSVFAEMMDTEALGFNFDGNTDGIFSFSDTVNETMDTENINAMINGSFFIYLNESSGNTAAAATKGESAKVGEISCETYTVNYSEEASAALFSEISKQVPDSESMSIARAIPDYNFVETAMTISNLKAALEGEKVISKPVSAKYYVDKDNKIRRAEYSAQFEYEGTNHSITTDVLYKGSGNVYDVVTINTAVDRGSDKLEFSADINRESTEQDMAVSKAKYDYAYIGGEGSTYVITLKSDTSKNLSDNYVEGDIELSGDWDAVSYIVGYKGVVETDKTSLDEFYINTPYADISFTLNFEILEPSSSPKSKDDLTYVEVLKASAEEIGQLQNEINNNSLTVVTKVLEALGM